MVSATLKKDDRQQCETSPKSGTITSNDAEQKVESTFTPPRCETFKDTGLNEALIESLVFKHLLAVGNNTCRGMARDLCLPPKSLLELLSELKSRQLLVYKGSASMGDFQYTLTDAGRNRSKGYIKECSFQGAAPVPLQDYIEAVHAQTITTEHPGVEQLKDAFSDLLINEKILERLGPAINSGRGLFLYGYPGNGKTSIAERISQCFSSTIWIPKTIIVDGEIIQLFDPQCHEAVPLPPIGKMGQKGSSWDTRWVRIKRPTIVVGGELTMDNLELCHNPYTKITEPPMQLKSNCGTLVIDDFGRQRMNPDALLNRWFVPLEKRYDFLTLANGNKIQVPFDQLIIFSTNLEPKELVDDAFLRRIPYKINICDPSEAEFRKLLKMMANSLDIQYVPSAVDYLIENHYRKKKRPFRCCHPRDLLLQIVHQSRYLAKKAVMSDRAFDDACENYFALL